eukprot:TRINITY_DN20884_c0_g1_i1.p1 TRINITY_DN20884_c0_g1~~TRINITY_DN20884_c0_g1_i1.p1  ORF type:complete len:437 (-),score=135.88 TRINITY_DN20884_c0_g1_i1:165-1475(-)
MLLLLPLVFLTGGVSSLENGLARTPPMGWLAWERFRCNTDCVEDPEDCISERLFKRMADLMVTEGYKDAGYEYIMMDDCWLSQERGEDGRLVADPDRFPSGIKALSDYVHKLGLKFGIYEDFGTETCGGYPGSLGHLETDAKTFAEWGVDFVKMDGCNSDPKDMDVGFSTFGAALAATGRPMIYQCEWPLYQGGAGMTPNYTAIREHCNVWRNFYDVQDNWNNIQGIIDHYGDDKDGFLEFGGPGGWNDPDMLVIGNFGLSYDQSKAQMALWVIFAAPLLMSNDLRTIRPEFKDILQHPAVLKVAQDPLGRPGRRVARKEHIDFFTRPIHPLYRGKHSFAVVIFNRWDMGGVPLKVSFTPSFLGLGDNCVFAVSDIYDGQVLGRFKSGDTIRVKVNPMGVRLLRVNIVQVFKTKTQVDGGMSGDVINPGKTGWSGD